MSARLPIASWRGAQGMCFGVILGDPEAATAIAADQESLRSQLIELARWLSENEPWRLETDWDRAEPIVVRIKARPRYHDGARSVPVPQITILKIPCIRLESVEGNKLCVQPHLGLCVSFDQDSELRAMIEHYAQESLRAMTPWELAAQVPPNSYSIEFISVPLRERIRGWVPPESRAELKVLFEVAEPLLRDRRLFGAAFGRQTAVLDLAERLNASRGNILLVGARGVGKTTLLCEAGRKAMRAPTQAEHHELRDYRLWRINGARLIAGMRYLGQWEERVERLIAGLSVVQGQFAAENLLELVRTGGDAPESSVAAFLLPYLQRGELRMVAEASVEEVQACRRLLPALLDQFELISVPAFAPEAALSVLREVALSIASSSVDLAGRAAHSAAPADQAVNAPSGRLAAQIPSLVQSLFQRFLPQAVVPGPAVRFLRKLAVRAKTEWIAEAQVFAEFARYTGLPIPLIRDDLPMDFAEVRTALARSVIGQADAVASAAQCVITLKAGLNDPERPIAVLLFSGPTGTGKTALAKALADFCFAAGAEQSDGGQTSAGASSRLIRLDLSEYQGFDAARRFLSADGVPARWLQQIDAQPFSVVLFDEIEKANPDIFDIMLGLLDEGRLTDVYGRRFDFRCAIIILTSNLGANPKASVGFHENKPSQAHAVSKYFRPEFFNRLDAVVPFLPLDAASVRQIAEKELRDLDAREGLQAFGLKLSWDANIVDLLVRTGFDLRFGARPLQRAVEHHVIKAIARWRLAHPQMRNVRLRLRMGDEGVEVSEVELTQD